MAAHDSASHQDSGAYKALDREPLVLNNRSLSWITNRICGVIENKQPLGWWLLFIPSVILTGIMAFCFVYLISTGVGVWGQKQPVDWAWDITNFVFWIGIGHAGTLISAILFLTRQKWRTSVNRAAEAMTIFAVMCAGLFPAFHVGRVWMVWFLAPIPNANAIWQNFKSPLLWDVFAVSTYFTVSLIFWYLGLVPDLATLRDRCKAGIRKTLYGMFALGWRGSNRHWSHYETAYMLLAALSTPLVLSVHSVVSFDFATSVVPGWHATIFPPYFVAGAIFGGFAMVLTLMIPVRAVYGLHDLITPKHIDNMAKIILLTGTIVGYAYSMEFFMAYYGANPFELQTFKLRAIHGPSVWYYYCMFGFNVFAPQLFWVRKWRTNLYIVMFVCMLINMGMWYERYVIIVTTLERHLTPGAWRVFHASWVDITTFVGTFGFFMMNFLLFLRFLPVIAIGEVKGVTPAANPHAGDSHEHGVQEDDVMGYEPPPSTYPGGVKPAASPAA